jgi:hypothetical protein
MRKLTSMVFLVVVLLMAVAVPVSAGMNCTPGYSVRDPFTGQLVDCLESDDGGDCLSCRMIIIVG